MSIARSHTSANDRITGKDRHSYATPKHGDTNEFQGLAGAVGVRSSLWLWKEHGGGRSSDNDLEGNTENLAGAASARTVKISIARERSSHISDQVSKVESVCKMKGGKASSDEGVFFDSVVSLWCEVAMTQRGGGMKTLALWSSENEPPRVEEVFVLWARTARPMCVDAASVPGPESCGFATTSGTEPPEALRRARKRSAMNGNLIW